MSLPQSIQEVESHVIQFDSDADTLLAAGEALKKHAENLIVIPKPLEFNKIAGARKMFANRLKIKDEKDKMRMEPGDLLRIGYINQEITKLKSSGTLMWTLSHYSTKKPEEMEGWKRASQE